MDRRVRHGRNSAVIASTIVAIAASALGFALAVVMLRQKPAETVVTPPASGTVATANGSMRVEYQEYQWRRGGQPVRMIRKEEGFCFLTRVNGEFAGMGEQARVYIGDDGYWYLHGSAFKPLAATAMSVRFVAQPFASASFPPLETWTQTLARLETSDNAQVREVAKAERAGLPQDPTDRVRFADLWSKAADAAPNIERAAMVSHAIMLYQTSSDLNSSATDGVAANLNRLREAALNDFSQWKPESGTWDVSVDGKIRGEGNASLLFVHQLPRDCSIEFHMNVMEGMRPRIRFPGTDFYIGNEGDEQTIAPYGAVSSRGAPIAYINNQDLKLKIAFFGERFELWIDDEVAARGTRKTPPQTVGLRLEAGDWWSAGNTLFWGFKLAPVSSL